MERQRIYAAIDLKSFYASVECMDRGLDPMTTNLVVADGSRTEKTICLAVSPSLKAFGIPGRPRLFEVVERVSHANAMRQMKAPGKTLTGKSFSADDLRQNPALAVDYITAPPRMAAYMAYSTRIYQIYLKYVAPEDIHVYSIDEVFLDLTPYLKTSGLTPRQFVQRMVRDVWQETCITATAGIGTNLYLCKIAMDIVAKRMEPDSCGMRIAELDEQQYRQLLWDHRPLTDFWRLGRGYAKKLQAHGLFTMDDVARCSRTQQGQALLYKLFGINAELLIDHAWGWEPCTIEQIRSYRPSTNSVCSGQVLHCPYSHEKARLIVHEMIDLLVLDLVDKQLVTDQIVLTVGYDIENLKDPERARAYAGPVVKDPYGRKIPKHGHGTVNLGQHTSSTKQITQAVLELFDTVADPALLVRRINLTANHVLPLCAISAEPVCQQLDLFTDPAQQARESADLAREKRRQYAELTIKKKFGKNAILKGMNLREGATTAERNRQIGGHKA